MKTKISRQRKWQLKNAQKWIEYRRQYYKKNRKKIIEKQIGYNRKYLAKK